MRLWSLHPKYLDTKGLTAVWREALLAKHVLAGKTKGYKHHPQLIRFRSHAYPLKALAIYLTEIWQEADRRGYHFDKTKIPKLTNTAIAKLPVTRGQLQYEHDWLCEKLKTREPSRYQSLIQVKALKSHPLFSIIKGPIEAWEKISQKIK